MNDQQPRKKVNHFGHLTLTLLTFGLWLPIWWLISAFYMGRDFSNNVQEVREAWRKTPRTDPRTEPQISRAEAIARGWDVDLMDPEQ